MEKEGHSAGAIGGDTDSECSRCFSRERIDHPGLGFSVKGGAPGGRTRGRLSRFMDVGVLLPWTLLSLWGFHRQEVTDILPQRTPPSFKRRRRFDH